MAPPKRTENRVRYYEKDDVNRFKLVLSLKTLGLSLEEMKELAVLYNREQKISDKIMPRLIELLDTHRNSIKEKVATLQRLEQDISEYRKRIVNQYQTS